MKLHRAAGFLLIALIGVSGLAGCSSGEKQEKEPDFSGIHSVCELATLKCYYHNVAKEETEASGFFKWLGTGYKKLWIEYSGIVELGIDVSQVSISAPDADGVVRITIPDAEVLNVDLDEASIGEPLTDTGLFTKITKEDETKALAAAQNSMEETVKEDEVLLAQAKARAKKLIEGYVNNVGEQIGEEYTVEWEDPE